MKDYAREENGGSCVMASCVDERFLPECMLDGKDGTFWLTTGMFPQEFVLALESPVRVSKITMLSLNGECGIHVVAAHPLSWFKNSLSGRCLHLTTFDPDDATLPYSQ